MTVPTYATSMIGNYRDAYREKYGEVFSGTDEQIWEILQYCLQRRESGA